MADFIKGLQLVSEEFKPGHVYIHGHTTGIASFYFDPKFRNVKPGSRTGVR